MNSKPLPKPTPAAPKKNDDSTVVFDQNKQQAQNDAKKSDDSGRVPLAQKPASDQKSATEQQPQSTGPKDANGTPLPPTSLSALSSMSSNKIPQAGAATPNTSGPNQTNVAGNPQNTPGGQQSGQPTTPLPERTVLGRPIPQALRGEAAPKGLTGRTPDPGKTTPKPGLSLGGAPKSPAPTPTAGGNAVAPSSPQQQSANGIKKENPSIDGKDDKKKPKIATAKSPIMRFLPFVAGGVVLLIVVVFIISRFMGGGSTSVSNNTTAPVAPSQNQQQQQQAPQRQEVPAEQTTVTYWGLWEPSEVMDQVIADFEADNPGIKINYVKQSHVDYRERLQTAINSGEGPDLFRYHASWVPMLESVLSPIPSSVASAGDFQGNYYQVVTDQLVSDGQYVGLPLMYDGLVLYYNEDILETAGETPPTTWPELRALAVKLTVKSADGIERGGLAIGNATNVEHFSDILASLILQNGGTLADADSVETRDALLFYTNFQAQDEVWDETLPSSTVAFARGDAAMMFAPSWRAHEVAALNPDLNFATTVLPQLSEEEPIAWASYWAEGISAKTDAKDAAVAFLTYLNEDSTLKKFYSAASEVRSFGEIYPKVSMADELSDNDVVASVLDDAVFAQSWYLNSYTHDNGINDQMITYYRTAITSILNGEDVEDAQETLATGVSQVLTQYGVSSK